MARSSSNMFPVSDHCDGWRFFNPGGSAGRTLWEVLRWKIGGTRKAWPKNLIHDPPTAPPPSPPPGCIAVTFVGHSTFLLQGAGIAMLTDPIWSERASPVTWAGPRRARPPGIPFTALPVIQYVLLSHNHYDHMDIPTLRRLEQSFQPRIITPLGNGRYLRRHGLNRVHELDWWQSIRPHRDVDVTLTPAQHFSARSLSDRDQALWGGFFIKFAGQCVCFAGDTGYAAHFQQMRDRLGSPDLALLPIGAYEPRWFMKLAHMNPAEAVLAHRNLGARQSIGTHFGTFQQTDEGIDEPVAELAAARAAANLGDDEFGVLGFGETHIVGRK
jgi:L-ascorbate metabolism protein UlaG (beta-lactamase superfamily)